MDEKQVLDEAYYHQTISHFEQLCEDVGFEHIVNSMRPAVAFSLMMALKARTDYEEQLEHETRKHKQERGV